MPGRLFLKRTIEDVAQALDATFADLTIAPRFNIAPGQNVIVATPDGTLAEMRWGIIPVGRVNARGRPVMETVINARSETVFEKSAFDGVKRCLIPTDGWYEWTGEKRRKTPWRISRKTSDLVVFAGIWDTWIAPNGVEIQQVAALTCEPNADVRDIHHRMGVILEPQDFRTWLTGIQEEAASLMQPLPEGRLKVEAAEGVDWSGP